MDEINKEKELLKKIEKAAAKGAKEGSVRGNVLFKILLIVIIPLAILIGLFSVKYSIEKKWNGFAQEFKAQFTFADPAISHDMVLDNRGILGYTSADFAEAVLRDGSQLKKVEVYEAKISDAVTLTDTGLANLNIFTKTQVITYNGVAIYTVDLSQLSKNDISLDEGEKKVAIRIPHSVCGKINIPSDEMEFGDTERGWLAFGEISMTVEQLSEVETEARNRMENKLIELNETEMADRFAIMTVWEIYQPIISSVSPEYKLEIIFSE